ncbi:High potential iron-sulfur protein [Ectothiorhodosinus mongolicus]|uniref:High-potential iron-sulfur protein n=1 Tax=Ectothiorhodosinus mongolicus TaxID=233100 RepID=A0A1R3VNH4_9GAMM|nr:High potential iron-sulfur protein [Ectothiorhodosinus mongolicus]
MKEQDVSRRKFLKAGAAGLVAVPVAGLGWTTTAAAGGHGDRLDESDPAAQALQYVHNTANPAQNCANCLLYNDPSQTEWGPCAVFPGKLVSANGWCTAWVARG